jgi:hypothetical protein
MTQAAEKRKMQNEDTGVNAAFVSAACYAREGDS